MRIRVVLFLAAVLTGCAQSDLTGSLFYLKPYHIEDLTCAELKSRMSHPTGRIAELRQLREKAAGAAGGGAIGTVVYGPDEEAQAWNKRMFEEEAARKGCPLETSPPAQ